MRKFIISFDYKGILFSAKVLVKRSGGKTIISTKLINRELVFFLDSGIFMFIQHKRGFKLILLKKDRSFEELDWRVKLEYLDKSTIVDLESFCMS